VEGLRKYAGPAGNQNTSTSSTRHVEACRPLFTFEIVVHPRSAAAAESARRVTCWTDGMDDGPGGPTMYFLVALWLQRSTVHGRIDIFGELGYLIRRGMILRG
jgi:hypothetical protein